MLVVGGGAIGLACALALLEAGRGVRVLEAGRMGGGASHGNCGTLTPSHAPPLAAPGTVGRALRWMLAPDAPLYLRPRWDPELWRWLWRFRRRCNPRDWRQATLARAALLDDSRARLPRWVERYGLRCDYAEEGLDYVFRDRRYFERHAAEAEVLRGFGIASETVAGDEYLRLQPAVREGVVGAVRFPGDARLRPERYVAELARAVRERGGAIEQGVRVAALEASADGVAVRAFRQPAADADASTTATGAATAGGTDRAPTNAASAESATYRGRDVVVALGAWSPRLAKSLGLRIPIQPGKGYSITYARPRLAPANPLVLKDRSVFVTAWEDGFRIGGTMEFAGYDAVLDPVRLAALERAAREYLREPAGSVTHERWCGWRPMTWDDLPLLGRVPGHARLWMAAGHGMLGISMSAGTGQLIADLLRGRTPAVDPTPYRLERLR